MNRAPVDASPVRNGAAPTISLSAWFSATTMTTWSGGPAAEGEAVTEGRAEAEGRADGAVRGMPAQPDAASSTPVSTAGTAPIRTAARVPV